MIDYCRDVLKFKSTMGLLINLTGKPAALSDFESALQMRLIKEEVGETFYKGIAKEDPIETIDGLADTLYVTIGAAAAYGFNLAEFVTELQNTVRLGVPDTLFARMDHFAGVLFGALRGIQFAEDFGDIWALGPALAGMVSTIGMICDAWNIPLRPFWDEVQRANMDKVGGAVREDGKRLKPPGWRPPNHAPIFIRVFGEERAAKYGIK